MSTSPPAPAAPETPRRRRRWWQFRLRTMLVGMTVVALVVGYWADRMRKQRRAIEALSQCDGFYYEYRHECRVEQWWPGWLERVVGVDGVDYVRYVRLHGEKPTDADLKWLRALHGLESLELRCMKVTDAGLVHLETLTNLRKLTVCDSRSGTGSADSAAHSLWWDLSEGSRCAPRNSWLLSEATDLYGEDLVVSESTFLEFDAYPLQSVFQYLSDFHEVPIQFTPAAWAVMNRPDGCPVTLSLRGVPLRTALDRLLRPLGLDWQFCRYALIICNPSEAAAAEAAATPITGAGLIEIEHLPHLTMLTLHARELDGSGLRPLGRLARLQGLLLMGTPLTDAALGCFRDAPQLRVLDLRGTQITDAGLSFLEGKPELRLLCLGGTNVSDAGLVHLAGLSNLKVLDLNGTAISDAGLAALADKRELRSLSLSGTRISDAGLVHLAGLKELQRLDLSETAVTEAGLAQLEKLPELRELFLIGVSLSDAAVPHLVRMEKLCTISCDGHAISAAGRAVLDTRHWRRSDWDAGSLKRAGATANPAPPPEAGR